MVLAGLDTVFLISAVLAFAGALLALALVRERDLEHRARTEAATGPAPA